MSYRIQLKSIGSEKEIFRYQIDSDFFSEREQSLLNGGQLLVEVEVERRNVGQEGYDVVLKMDGSVVVTCDRCLGDMDVPVHAEQCLTVKLGTQEENTDTTVVVNEREGQLDLSALIYDYAALSVPIHPTHSAGACNAEMVERLNRYLVTEEFN